MPIYTVDVEVKLRLPIRADHEDDIDIIIESLMTDMFTEEGYMNHTIIDYEEEY